MSKPTIKQLMPWVVVLSSALYFFFAFVNMNTFDALNDDIRQGFSLTALQVSNLSAMYFYANVIFMIPAGMMLDRFSTRKLILSGLFIMIVATVVFSLTNSYWLAIVCRFVTGMAATLCLLSAIRLTSRWFESQYGGLVLGIVVTFAMLGGMLSQDMIQFSRDLGTWRHALQAVAILGAIFWIINFIFVKDRPKNQANNYAQEQQLLKEHGFWRSFGQALANIQNWIAGCYANFLSIPIIVLGALWGHDYLVTAKGVSSAAATEITSMIFLGMIFGSPISGWLSDVLKRRKLPMIVGAVLSLVIALVIYYTQSHNTTYLAVLFFLMGFLPGTQVIVYPYFIEVNPKHLTATSASLGSMIVMAAGAIFQPLFGYILEQHAIQHGTQQAYTAADYNHAFLILPITFVITIILAVFIKETRCKQIV